MVGGKEKKIGKHELYLLLIIITWSYDSLGAVVGQPVEKWLMTNERKGIWALMIKNIKALNHPFDRYSI